MIGKIIGFIWRKMPRRLRLKAVRVSQAKFVVSVGGIITNNAGEVLLLNHVLRASKINWGIPGGFITYDEQPADALRRELKEEINLQIEDLELISIKTMNPRHVEIIFRACALNEPEIKSFEIKDFGWFQIDDLPGQISRGQARVIKKSLGG